MLTPPSSPLPTKRRSWDDDWEPPKAPTPYSAEPLLSALQAKSLPRVMSAIAQDETSVFLPLQGLGRGWHGRIPPLLEAVRCRCSVDILRVLLQHGALADDRDAQGMNALTELVGQTYKKELHSCEAWSERIDYGADYYKRLKGCLGRDPDPVDSIKTNSGIEITVADLNGLEGDRLRTVFPIQAKLQATPSPHLCLLTQNMTEDDIYERVWLLLSHGADPWCKDVAGRFMAIQRAHRHGLTRIVELFQHWDGRLARRVLSRWWERNDEGVCVASQVSIPRPVSNLIFEFVA